jgi:general secretion pathway protein E
VLVVGPLGSGRRAALRSMLEQLDPARRNIHTLQGRRWVRTFGRIPRRGADAVLVEKIDSAAMARLAIRAAQAGHLVLSTMALGRACSVIGELRRLRVTTTQVIEALSLAICQRLVRRLCPDCSLPDEREPVRRALAGALNTWLGGHAVQPRQAAPSGCARCGHTGYLGKVLAYELIELDMRARGLIASVADPVELESALLAEGRSIWDRGLKQVAEGATSLDALLSAVRQPR